MICILFYITNNLICLLLISCICTRMLTLWLLSVLVGGALCQRQAECNGAGCWFTDTHSAHAQTTGAPTDIIGPRRPLRYRPELSYFILCMCVTPHVQTRAVLLHPLYVCDPSGTDQSCLTSSSVCV